MNLYYKRDIYFLSFGSRNRGPSCFPTGTFFMAKWGHRCAAPWQTVRLYTDNNTCSEAVMSVNTTHFRSQAASVRMCACLHACVSVREPASHFAQRRHLSLSEASVLIEGEKWWRQTGNENQNYIMIFPKLDDIRSGFPREIKQNHFELTLVQILNFRFSIFNTLKPPR